MNTEAWLSLTTAVISLGAASALAATVAEKPGAVASGLHASVISIQHLGETQATGRLLITNQSKQTVDLTNALIEFATPYRVIEVSGSFFPISMPDRRVLVSERIGGQYNNQLVLAFSENQKLQTELHPGSTLSLMLKFESKAKLGQSSAKATIFLSDKDQQVSYQHGQLLFRAPKAPGPEVKGMPAVVTVKGVGDFEKRVAVDWGQKFILDQLPYGEYTVHTEQVGDFPGMAKQSIRLSNRKSAAVVKIKYDEPVYTTAMQLVTPAEVVDRSDSLTAYIQDVTHGEHPKQLQLQWAKTQQLNNLVVGHRYRLWFNPVKRWPFQYKPSASAEKPFEFTASKEAVQQFNLTFQQSLQPTGELAVATQVTGLPFGAKATLTLHPVSGGEPVTRKLSVGQDSLTNVEPGEYWLTASDYIYQGKIYRATLSSTKLNLSHHESARVHVEYAENNKLVFAGSKWRIKQGSVKGGRWAPENVFVDQRGRLHLVLEYQNGQWLAAGIESVDNFSSGQLQIKTVAQASNLLANGQFSVSLQNQDKNSGLGFTMRCASNCQDTTNGVITHYWLQQKAQVESKQSVYNWQASRLTHSINWNQNGVLFETKKGHSQRGLITLSQQYLPAALDKKTAFPLQLMLTPQPSTQPKGRKVEIIINSITSAAPN
ncbi:hypothetical protein [Spartinivicinus poritis]|uniref:Uncharacterized protein n=1 Tax=Spartinivicinus poritis TaxID=2994640 RepID=A0ABT5U8Z9_9GAMM|nr:hypothetical protein [Spartinivicinus sp. A2-2]MDE1462851.1 hypothetical protein [Spartinivicinus sp. A2-2]